MQDMAEPEEGLAYTAAFDRFYTGFTPWYGMLVRLFPPWLRLRRRAVILRLAPRCHSLALEQRKYRLQQRRDQDKEQESRGGEEQDHAHRHAP